MADVVVLVPVLRRPQRAAMLVRSFEAATPADVGRLLFICTEGDDDEIAAVEKTEADFIVLPGERQAGDWSRKINYGYRSTNEPLMLLGGDDLHFHPGWYQAVAAKSADGFGVIGTQDLGSPRVIAGTHATHPVVARWYADMFGTVDGPGQVVCEKYGHQFVDDELVETAKLRGQWTFAPDAVVEHRHPSWLKATIDDTYVLGRSTFDEDRRIYRTRRILWT